MMYRKLPDPPTPRGSFVLTGIVAILVIYLLTGGLAKADWVTEFGMGYKMPDSTSFVLRPECTQVISTQPQLRHMASCGGDNPAFIGWPIAYQHVFKYEVVSIRAGWFHYSNWFDGGNIAFLNHGDQFETHMDLAAVTVTWNWSAMKRKRKQ